jgi:hypothetical protein
LNEIIFRLKLWKMIQLFLFQHFWRSTERKWKQFYFLMA